MRSPIHRRLVFALFALSLTLTGCAAAGAAGGEEGDTRVRRSSTRITAEELAAVSELDVYSAIQRLRPAWLRAGVRGAVPELIVDGTRQSSGLDGLRAFRASDVQALELMSASDATTRYGTGYTAGAILVTTRR